MEDRHLLSRSIEGTPALCKQNDGVFLGHGPTGTITTEIIGLALIILGWREPFSSTDMLDHSKKTKGSLIGCLLRSCLL
jgi:hypothetical protein